MTKHFRPFFISAVFFVSAVFFCFRRGKSLFWKLDVFHGGARVGLGFEAVISESKYYTIYFI